MPIVQTTVFLCEDCGKSETYTYINKVRVHRPVQSTEGNWITLHKTDGSHEVLCASCAQKTNRQEPKI